MGQFTLPAQGSGLNGVAIPLTSLCLSSVARPSLGSPADPDQLVMILHANALENVEASRSTCQLVGKDVEAGSLHQDWLEGVVHIPHYLK